LISYRSKRLLHAKLYRLTHWEFWPRWAVYWPLGFYLPYLCLRYRSLTLPSAVNPGMPRSGIICRSKSNLLSSFRNPEYAAPHILLERAESMATRLQRAKAFIAEREPAYPVVLKPNSSERAEGVAIIRDEQGLVDYLAVWESDVILQEYVPGVEYGVFYMRLPGEERGFIFSIVDKRFTSVTGDGQRTLERLILDDDRASLSAELFLERHRHRLREVPAAGETVRLVEVGNHCRGAMFLDGCHLATPELTEAVDRISKSFPEFYFGRYDLRAPSEADFRAGRNLKVIEINGQPSEATHIYDPKHSWFYAIGVLFRQWRYCFRIGAANRARGHRPIGWREALALLFQWRERVKQHERSFAKLNERIDDQAKTGAPANEASRPAPADKLQTASQGAGES